MESLGRAAAELPWNARQWGLVPNGPIHPVGWMPRSCAGGSLILLSLGPETGDEWDPFQAPPPPPGMSRETGWGLSPQPRASCVRNRTCGAPVKKHARSQLRKSTHRLVLSRLVRGESEVSLVPPEEEMTYQTDLPRRVSISHSQKTKESEREDSLQAPGCKLPFFLGFDGTVMADEPPGGGGGGCQDPPPPPRVRPIL